MTQTLRAAAPVSAQFNGNGGVGPAQQRRRRVQSRAGVVVLGLVGVAMAVLLFESLVPKTPQAREVLVAAQQIRAGEVIGPSDLGAVSVASSQLRGIPVSDRDRIVGQTAALDVAAGQALVSADVGGGAGPAPGEAVVGLSLEAGRLPVGLAVGDTVVVVLTPGSSTGAVSLAPVSGSSGPSSPAGGTELGSGRVLSVGPSADGTRTNVSLILPTTSADAVAATSASDSVSLVWIPS